jgi:hypothetical protein
MWFGGSLLANFVCIYDLAPVQQRFDPANIGLTFGDMARSRQKRKGSHLPGKVHSEWIGPGKTPGANIYPK